MIFPNELFTFIREKIGLVLNPISLYCYNSLVRQYTLSLSFFFSGKLLITMRLHRLVKVAFVVVVSVICVVTILKHLLLTHMTHLTQNTKLNNPRTLGTVNVLSLRLFFIAQFRTLTGLPLSQNVHHELKYVSDTSCMWVFREDLFST